MGLIAHMDTAPSASGTDVKPRLVKYTGGDIVLNEDAHSGIITLVEGKYHQIKRMLEALHNQITYLERISFGPLTLQAELARGAWRELSAEEEAALRAAAE